MLYEFIDNRDATEGTLVKISIRENEITNKIQITLEHISDRDAFDPLDKLQTNLHHCVEVFTEEEPTEVYNEATGEYDAGEPTTKTSILYEHTKNMERSWSLVVKPEDVVAGLERLKPYIMDQFSYRVNRMLMGVDSFIKNYKN